MAILKVSYSYLGGTHAIRFKSSHEAKKLRLISHFFCFMVRAFRYYRCRNTHHL